MRSWVVLVLASALACTATRSQSVSSRLGEEVTLAVGQTATWPPDLRIRVAAVVEDSRCPTETTCVWAGQLKVRLTLNPEKENTTHELLESEHTDFANRRVTFVRASPAATSRKLASGDYRIVLRADNRSP